jgi:hypothetical protein
MEKVAAGRTLGAAGLAVLLTCWIAVYLARMMPDTWVPRVWLVIITLGLPSTVIAGVAAGRMASRWWYVLSALGFLTAVVMLADVAV